MRGLPGSGKSTKVKSLISGLSSDAFIICTADDFFIQEDGSYVFDYTKIKDAHDECFYKFIDGISRNIPLIIVDNTNTTRWEVSKYLDVYEKYAKEKYELSYEFPDSDHWDIIYDNIINKIFLEEDAELLAEKNTHGVPKDTIMKMMRRFEFFN